MRASLTLAAAVLLGVALSAGTANATCKRFGFTVNDYGKDGPTKDAKDLLDKHIAEWAAQNKIKDYKTGSKTVNCELFLNFVVFDEHTCTASANVCWNDGKGKSTPETAAATPEDGEPVPPTPIRKAALMGHDKKAAPSTADAQAMPPAATDAPSASPPAEEAATPPATPAAATTEVTAPSPPPAPPAEPAKAADMAPPSPPPGVVETGTLPKEPLTSLKQHAAADATSPPNATPTPPPAAPAASAPKKDPAAATAAATAAAAAAERAAVAAETAAAAAKEAAAAAVAASAASKGAVVPPLDGGP